jgi:hypothetical protein
VGTRTEGFECGSTMMRVGSEVLSYRSGFLTAFLAKETSIVFSQAGIQVLYRMDV